MAKKTFTFTSKAARLQLAMPDSTATREVNGVPTQVSRPAPAVQFDNHTFRTTDAALAERLRDHELFNDRFVESVSAEDRAALAAAEDAVAASNVPHTVTEPVVPIPAIADGFIVGDVPADVTSPAGTTEPAVVTPEARAASVEATAAHANARTGGAAPHIAGQTIPRPTSKQDAVAALQKRGVDVSGLAKSRVSWEAIEAAAKAAGITFTEA